jgi:amino acid transporter
LRAALQPPHSTPAPRLASLEMSGVGDGDMRQPLLPSERKPSNVESWQFPGRGRSHNLDVMASPLLFSPRPGANGDEQHGTFSQIDLGKDPKAAPHPEHAMLPEEEKLGQWYATAISGNDILSSCLYTVGLTAAVAGVYSPIAILIVVVMLYFFRAVYVEVCTALPLNGGAYNALLNTTSKANASIAACLTILSYIATGVVSGGDACQYLQTVWEELPVKWATIALLALFALLTVMGITDSARVAFAIFSVHCGVLLALVVASVIHVGKHGFHVFHDNLHADLQPPFLKAVAYGFSAAALGITGFETSANFIEEQKEGVFPKTLRNMWALVFFFNPVLSFLALCTVKMARVLEGDNRNVLLSIMAEKVGGHPFKVVLGVDGFLVLAGSVLTAYVGVVGLVRRLAGDRCLPAFLMQRNQWRGTNHWIIFGFFLICSSLYLMVNGNLTDLGGVYSIAFLSVMSLFALANMTLKYKRGSIPRALHASWLGVGVAFMLVATAWSLTVALHPDYLRVFLIYFVGVAVIFMITYYRIQFLRILRSMLREIAAKVRCCESCLLRVTSFIHEIQSPAVVFYAKTPRIDIINKAVLYVRANEHSHHIYVVHVCPPDQEPPEAFRRNVEIVDSLYPKIRIDAVLMRGHFGPDAVRTVEAKLNVLPNMQFIKCPSENFLHKIASLGGVRVITG